MRRFVRMALVFLVPLTLLLQVGCGSSGGGSGGASVAGRAALQVYVTDGFGDAYKQVLVTLYKIELTTDGTTCQTVFEHSAGQTLNLSSLSDTAQLLASLSIPAGTYTAAKITFGDHFTLVSKSGDSTSVAVSSTAATVADGKAVVTVTTPTKALPGQVATLFVDFKLAEFTLTAGTLRPSIRCGDASQHPGKKLTVHLNGTVANLVDGTSFDLQGINGTTTKVTLASTTAITSGQTGGVITLANGQSVLVEGTFDSAGTTVTATSVTLNDYTTIKRARANGTVASVDTSATSFVLTVDHTDGIQPTGGTIIVQTDANTIFVKGRRSLGAFTDIAASGAISAGGTFDVTTQTLTAKVVQLR